MSKVDLKTKLAEEERRIREVESEKSALDELPKDYPNFKKIQERIEEKERTFGLIDPNEEIVIELDPKDIKYIGGKRTEQIHPATSQIPTFQEVFRRQVEHQKSENKEKITKERTNLLRVNPFIEVDYDDPLNSTFPEYFGEVAKMTFLSVLQQYIEEELLTKLDVSVLMLFARTVEKVHEAEYKFAIGEYMNSTPTNSGDKESIELKQHNINQNLVKSLSSLLLINPQSRKSLDPNKKKSDKPEPTLLEKFIASRNAKNKQQ